MTTTEETSFREAWWRRSVASNT